MNPSPPPSLHKSDGGNEVTTMNAAQAETNTTLVLDGALVLMMSCVLVVAQLPKNPEDRDDLVLPETESARLADKASDQRPIVTIRQTGGSFLGKRGYYEPSAQPPWAGRWSERFDIGEFTTRDGQPNAAFWKLELAMDQKSESVEPTTRRKP